MKRILSLFLLIAMVFSFSLPGFAAEDEAIKAANDLYHKGLFQGKGTDETGKPIYALEDGLNRYEGVTMMVRLLGKEAEAKAGSWETPFPDVVDWAKPYIGYAYANGLTTGTTNSKGELVFSGEDALPATQYLTLVLRALGYSSSEDFRWDKAWELSDKLGITDGEYDENTASFLRSDLVIISKRALDQKLKGEKTTLWEKIEPSLPKPEDKPDPAPEPEKPSGGIVTEPIDQDLPYFVLDGKKIPATYEYNTAPGTYVLSFYAFGERVTDFTEFDSEDPSICSAADNGDGTFTLTAKKNGTCSIRVYFNEHPQTYKDANGQEYTEMVSFRSDLSWSVGDVKLPGISLFWHGGYIESGYGFGFAGHTIFVTDVMLDGVKQTEYTVSGNSTDCTFTVQSDGSLLIEKPNGGEVNFSVTCGGKTGNFRVMS